MTTEDPAISPPAGTKAEELLEQLEIARAAREHARKVRAGKPVVGRWPRKLPIPADNTHLANRLRNRRDRFGRLSR